MQPKLQEFVRSLSLFPALLPLSIRLQYKYIMFVLRLGSERPSPSRHFPTLKPRRHAVKAAPRSRNMMRDFETQEADRMTSLWMPSNDVMCMHPGDEPVVGQQAVARSWRSLFRSGDDRFSSSIIKVLVCALVCLFVGP